MEADTDAPSSMSSHRHSHAGFADLSLRPDQYSKYPEIPLSDRPTHRRHDIDDVTFQNGMSPCFATLGATARTMPLQILGTKGWLELRDESPLVFHPMDGSLETIDYPLFGKERAKLEDFADAVAGKSTYPLSDTEAIHGIKVFEAIAVSTGGAGTVTIG